MLAHALLVHTDRHIAMAAVQTFPALFGHLKILPVSNNSEKSIMIPTARVEAAGSGID
jgi:hypothetical protein